MYAIIEDSGRQHKVTAGDTIKIERETAPTEKTLSFDRVLLIGGEGEPKIGAPLLVGASVIGEITEIGRGPKVISTKYKRRKGYHKRKGHRQPFIAVKITGINA